jgi:phosphatidate phosphatase PAH1
MFDNRLSSNWRSVPVTLLVTLIAAFATIGVVTASASAAGNDVVVFDIDGTLTKDTLSNTPHPGAVDAVKAYKAKGYSVVYLTARWKPVQELYTRAWLALNGFPDQPLYMSSSLLISDSSTVKYKTAALAKIESGTPEVKYAYGDSSTDFQAYANAGVPTPNVFALKRAGSTSCEPGAWSACLVNYTGHLPFIGSLPAGT